MKIGPYEREVAFRAIGEKKCPSCGGWRRASVQIFCERCERQLTPGVMKGLRNRASFAWAYYKALDILRELSKQEKEKSGNG